MTNVIPERKERVIKSLALFGLFGVIIFIAWLSVQIVSIFPSAVTSLASLADSVYSYDPKADREVKLVDAPEHFTTGVPTTIRYEKPFETGTYSFSYSCGKDVFIEIKSTESEFAGLECNKSYNLGNVDNFTLIVHEDNTESKDLTYTIAHFKTNATKESAQVTTTSGIILGSEVAIGPETSVEVTVNEQPITPKPTTGTVTTKPSVPVITKPAPAPTNLFSYTYKIPVSDPKGYTDLSVSYLGIGTTNTAGNFVNTGSLKQDQAGAIQFTVHNTGTKTSNLPGDVEYTSKVQAPLKPNEKATLTISFPAVDELKLQKFTFTAKLTGDTNLKNNTINWSTIVLK
jgi:hypothetical protein